MSAASWGLIGFLSLLWGGSFFFTELVIPYVGPLTLAAGRVFIAAAGLWAWVAGARNGPPMDLRLWGWFVLVGTINFALSFVCFAWAQTQLTGGLTAIINAMTPIMVVIVSQFWPGGERASWLRSAGVVVGIAGVAVLVAPTAGLGLGGPLAAELAALGGPLCYAVALNLSRRFANLDPTAAVTGTMTGASLVAVPLALIVEGPPPVMPFGSAAALMALGLVSTGFAFRFMYLLLPRVGATNFSVVTFLVPLSAIGLGTVFLGERLEASHIAGMLVIFVGLALVDGRIVRVLLQRRA
jgi:drug/metabolite transporter (DMT)-like permease